MSEPPKPPRISVAHMQADGRMHAPAAERNADAIEALLVKYAPRSGKALELASGTGQHITRFAAALPDLIWQPSEIAADRLTSIALWATEAGLGNLRPPLRLDATTPGWHAEHGARSLIVLVNLLHLISAARAKTILSEVSKSLLPGGRFIFYGPFLRGGEATSAGDRQFHASLKAKDPEIGYKNDADVIAWIGAVGLHLHAIEDMPANNLAFVAEKRV